MLEITEAKYFEGYTIRVTFNNGEAGIADLSQALWGPMFEPLKDLTEFKKIKISETLHTICWENEADHAPEYVYERMVEQSAASGASGYICFRETSCQGAKTGQGVKCIVEQMTKICEAFYSKTIYSTAGYSHAYNSQEWPNNIHEPEVRQNMEDTNILREITALPPEAQKQILDFMAFLKARYPPVFTAKKRKRIKLTDEPFIGMWSTRKEMQDSTAWVRKVRQREWEHDA